jgi:bacterioferritin
MQDKGGSLELISLLNRGVAREMGVSIQYMLQHSIWNAKESAKPAGVMNSKQSQFIRDRSAAWLPGLTLNLKAIAVTEMRHAGDIAERIVQLGGEPTTHPDEVSPGRTPKEMIELDREREHSAIELYQKIIGLAKQEGDEITLNLFQRILAEEEEHHKVFSELLETP